MYVLRRQLLFRRILTGFPRAFVDVKLNDLTPNMTGVNVVVLVLEKEEVVNRDDATGVNLKLEECVVGDETGKLVFTARNGKLFEDFSTRSSNCGKEQCDEIVEGQTVELRNARVNLHEKNMRLVVDKWGLIDTDTDKVINEEDIPDVNYSDTQYDD